MVYSVDGRVLGIPGEPAVWALADAIHRWPEWVVRRVDSVHLFAGERGRLRHSIDCIPIADPQLAYDAEERGQADIDGVRGLIMVPLAFVKKLPLRDLDTQGPDGHPMPMMGKAETDTLVTWLVLQILEQSGVPLSDETHEVVKQIMEADYPPTLAQVERLLGTGVWRSRRLWASTLRLGSPVVAFIKRLFLNTLMIGLIPASVAGQRQVLKLSYFWSVTKPTLGERIRLGGVAAGGAHYALRIPAHMSAEARSYHFDFAEPAELGVTQVVVEPWGPSSSERTTRILLFVPWRGLRSVTTIAVGATLIAYLTALNLDVTGGGSSNRDGITLLLSLAAIFVGFLALRQEPSFVSRILAPLRATIAVCSSLLLLLAGAIGLRASPTVLHWLSASGALACGVASVVLLGAPSIRLLRKPNHSRHKG